LLAPRSTPKLENHPFSVVRDCLFNIFVTILLEVVSSIRNLRTRLAVVTRDPLFAGSINSAGRFICQHPLTVAMKNGYLKDVFETCHRIAQSVYRRATGWTTEVLFPTGTTIFLYSTASRLALGPTSYPMDDGCLFTRGKQSWHEVDHSSPSSAEVKNGGAMPPHLHPSSWRGA
jgi:hypothetical protein